ncbi:alpha/beta hydrolase family protein [Caulobacter radicis]|uniref:alpha/beta hydrolase family protein n=1 Tax=Caulobacter radicis TaxID=2172650 RepID=UPI001403D962|nr:S9 family peptidase [Caulobacter radicis]
MFQRIAKPAMDVARLTFVCIAVLLVGLGASARAEEEPEGPPEADPEKTVPSWVAELFARPNLQQGLLSPDGRYLSIVSRKLLTHSVQLIDLSSNKQSVAFDKPGAEYSTIDWQAWKDARTLLVSYTGRGDWPAVRRHRISRRWLQRVVAIDVATGRQTELPLAGLTDILRDDPDHVLMQEATGGRQFLRKVNVRTGEAATVDQTRDGDVRWDTNRKGEPVIRYDMVGRGGVRLQYRPTPGAPWATAFTLRPKEIEALPDFAILEAGPDVTSFYVAVMPEGDKGSRELRLYDFKTRTMGPVIYAAPSHDFDSIAFDPRDGAVLGACYVARVRTCEFFDKVLQRERRGIEKFFEGERNVKIISASDDGAVQLLYASGPDEPGSYYLYRRAEASIKLLGLAWPSLKPDTLGRMTEFAYAASDGQKLVGYVTRPPKAKPEDRPPLVVMPHGGPEARDQFDFDPWAQVLARAGYVVFQPQFRGSGGFGRAFASAGYGQWGLRMQDDVLEGVEALIRDGKVDPDRVCIFGASYGGYVALQAGAKHPERFKCVISQAGVSDLVASQDWERRTSGADSPTYQYWLKSIGDPVKDRERLVATSPITYAAEYRPPVLLLHGDYDGVVPLEQSQLMEKALAGAGRKVELVTYRAVGHSQWRLGARLDAMRRILSFLSASIGPTGTNLENGSLTPPPPPPAAPPPSR